MNLRDAHYFVVVADAPSFGRAAERCYLTQQALSAAMARLEREIGEPLFLRHKHGVELTAAGECLLPRARGLVELADRTLAAVREAAREPATGCLRVGVMGPAAAELTTPIIQAFRVAHPGLTVAIRELSFRGVGDAVVAGQVDVAIGVGPFDEDERLRQTTIFREPRALLVARDHPLADAGIAPVSAALDLEFLPGAELDQAWIGFWRLEELRNGEPARLAAAEIAEAHTPSEVNEVVAAGVGVVGVPLSHSRRSPHDGVSLVRLAGIDGTPVSVLEPLRRQSLLGADFVEVARTITRDLIGTVQDAWVEDNPPVAV